MRELYSKWKELSKDNRVKCSLIQLTRGIKEKIENPTNLFDVAANMGGLGKLYNDIDLFNQFIAELADRKSEDENFYIEEEIMPYVSMLLRSYFECLEKEFPYEIVKKSKHFKLFQDIKEIV